MKHNDLPPLPDEIIEQSRQYSATGDMIQWTHGDFLVGVMEELGPYYAAKLDTIDQARAMRKARAWIIHQLAVQTGADKSTLRDRHIMAQFYPEQVRRKWDMLTYHQLRACKFAGDKWEKFAAWAVESADDFGGRPAPVAAIRNHIRNGGAAPAAWEGRWSRVVSLCDSIADDEEAPPGVRLAARLVSMGVWD